MVVSRSLATSPAVVVALALLVGVGSGLAALMDSPLVPPVVLAAIGIVAVTLRVPVAGVLAFVLIASVLPFAVLPVRVVFALTLVDLALTALLVAWLARLLLRREPLVRTAVDAPLIVFVVVAIVAFVLGTAHSPTPGETVRLFLKLINSTLLFFGATQVVRSQRDLARVTRTLIAGGAAAAMLALALYLLPGEGALDILGGLGALGYPTGPDVLRPLAGTETLRATGTSVDPNLLGGLLMSAGTLAVAQLLATQAVLSRPWLIALVLPILGVMPLTYSRSAWVGLAAGVGFLALFRERKAWAVIGLAIAALVALPQGQTVLARLGSGLAASDQASVMRLDEYRNAFQIIQRYPMLGIGFGDAPDVDLTAGVSSIYLLLAEQVGLVGLACFLSAVGLALWLSFRAHIPRDGQLGGLVSGLQAALVAALVAGLFDHYFVSIRFPHMVALFWLLVALLLVATGLAVERNAQLTRTEMRQ